MLSCFTVGYIIFAIGFADADYGELVNIASKPSERHVFFVDDLDAFKKIEEQLITFVCEAATASTSLWEYTETSSFSLPWCGLIFFFNYY